MERYLQVPYTQRLLSEHSLVDLFLVMLGTNDPLQCAAPEEAASRMEAFLGQPLPYCNQILLVA